ncbi:hypothetical protein DMA11_01900 [Marinilabiliaceae bacterium JC017]|nr:hypothetical protein DMA11_01900 [Marinilabiliaceae bacterium JC017]
MSNLNHDSVIEEISSLPFNVKAEVIAASLIEEGLAVDEIEVTNEGAFFRPFRKDVTHAQVKNSVSGDEILELFLPRNSLYDLLPEGMCHSQEVLTFDEKKISELSAVYRKRKREEVAARRFFKPIENEFFRQQVHLEQKERNLLSRKKQNFNEFLIRFWQINRALTEPQIQFFIRLFPVVKKMKGDFAVIAATLSRFFNLPVSHRLDYLPCRVTLSAQPSKRRLGHNLITGATTEHLPRVTFIFQQIPGNELPLFLEGGVNRLFVQELLKHTIPIEYETDIELIANKEDSQATESYGSLGYTMII